MTPEQFKQMIQWSTKNPNTPQATEFKSRIESGRYNNTISQLGFKPEQFGYKAPPPVVKKEEPPSFAQKAWSFTKAIPGALISSEKKFGESIAAASANVLPESWTGVKEMKIAQDAHATTIQRWTDLIRSAKQRGQTEKVKQYSENLKNIIANPPPGFADLYPAVNKTALQVLGEAGGVALDILTAGTLSKVAGGAKALKTATTAEKVLSTGQKVGQIAKTTGKAILKGGAIGYGYDVTQGLQEGETGEAFKPGLGTALGVAIPGVVGGYQMAKTLAKGQAPRLINSLIKPLQKDFAYGKDPGRTIAKRGIVANDWDDLIAKIGENKNQVGSEIGELTSSLEGKTSLELQKALDPIDDAIRSAAKTNNKGLVNRLQEVRTALTDKLELAADDVIDEAGNVITKAGDITSVGKRTLTGAQFSEGQEIKKFIGDLTKWTGNKSDDEAINKALKQSYGIVKDEMITKAKQVNPKVASKLTSLSEQYGDLMSAEVAAKYRDKIIERSNIVSMPIKVGSVAGLVTSVATGGVATVPGVIAGVSIGILDKAMESPAFKTRLAAWLAKESPTMIQKVFQKNPAIQSAIYKAFNKEVNVNSTAKKIIDKLNSIPSKQAGISKAGALTGIAGATALGLGGKALIESESPTTVIDLNQDKELPTQKTEIPIEKMNTVETEDSEIDIPRLKAVIKYLETRGKENPYNFKQPSGIETLGDAIGAYQITQGELDTVYPMLFNGKKVSLEEFQNSKFLQDRYITKKIEYLQKRGYTVPEILAMHFKGMFVGGLPEEAKTKSRFYDRIRTKEEKEGRIKAAGDYVTTGMLQYNQ